MSIRGKAEIAAKQGLVWCDRELDVAQEYIAVELEIYRLHRHSNNVQVLIGQAKQAGFSKEEIDACTRLSDREILDRLRAVEHGSSRADDVQLVRDALDTDIMTFRAAVRSPQPAPEATALDGWALEAATLLRELSPEQINLVALRLVEMAGNQSRHELYRPVYDLQHYKSHNDLPPAPGGWAIDWKCGKFRAADGRSAALDDELVDRRKREDRAGAIKTKYEALVTRIEAAERDAEQTRIREEQERVDRMVAEALLRLSAKSPPDPPQEPAPDATTGAADQAPAALAAEPAVEGQ